MSRSYITCWRSSIGWLAGAGLMLVASGAWAQESEPAPDAKLQTDELAAMSVPHLGLRTDTHQLPVENAPATATPVAPVTPAAAAIVMHGTKPSPSDVDVHAIATSGKIEEPVAPVRPVVAPVAPIADELKVAYQKALTNAARATGEAAAHGDSGAPGAEAGAGPAVTAEELEALKNDLEAARQLRTKREAAAAIPILEKLVTRGKVETIKQGALLELGYGAQDMNELARAQTIFTQFVNHWPNDSRVPEVLLRLGQNYRQTGLNNLALAKFYAVMTAALALKSDQVGVYQKLVLQAQMEIAETNFQMGKYADAAEFFSRLLKQNDPSLDRPQTLYRLIRSLAATEKYEDTAQQAQEFLNRYNDAPQQPEVRFLLAQALKQTSRNSEALQQVLLLLKEQKLKNQPEAWAYWQQRAGNEIGNQLYRDGDYPRALSVYQALAELDPAPSWKLPVTYQVGMTYERLLQPAKAIETYNFILAQQAGLKTNESPNLKAVFEMAKWRSGFLQWQTKAEDANRIIANPAPLVTATITNLNASVAAQ